MKDIAIIGDGGHAREVMCQMSEKLFRFVDDKYWNPSADMVFPISQFDPHKFKIMICISDPIARKEIVDRLPKETRYFSFIHPTALIMDDNIQIGEGSFIGAYSILTTNIKIGKHAILNRGNHIGHDSRIGDFFSAMPGAIVSGNVTIGDCVYLGTNSSIKEKINICGDTTIGLGSGVVKNITNSGIYGGVPAKKIKL